MQIWLSKEVNFSKNIVKIKRESFLLFNVDFMTVGRIKKHKCIWLDQNNVINTLNPSNIRYCYT